MKDLKTLALAIAICALSALALLAVSQAVPMERVSERQYHGDSYILEEDEGTYRLTRNKDKTVALFRRVGPSSASNTADNLTFEDTEAFITYVSHKIDQGAYENVPLQLQDVVIRLPFTRSDQALR